MQQILFSLFCFFPSFDVTLRVSSVSRLITLREMDFNNRKNGCFNNMSVMVRQQACLAGLYIDVRGDVS